MPRTRAGHQVFTNCDAMPLHKFRREFAARIWPAKPAENVSFIGDVDRVRPSVAGVTHIELAAGKRPRRHLAEHEERFL